MKEKPLLSKNGVEVEEQIKLSGHKWQVSCLSLSINGVYVASGSWDKRVRIWDLRVLTTSTELGNDENGHKSPVTSVSWFPNIEFLLASGSADNTVRIWNSESGERLSVLEAHTGWVLGTSFNHSGSVLASSSWDKSIGLWDINTLKLSQTLNGHTGGVWKTAFRTFDGDNILCSASEDSSLKLWDLRTQQKWFPVSNLVGVHDDGVKCCAWSPCGNYVAAGAADSKISVWDIRENRCLHILYGHHEMVTDLKFLPLVTSKGNEVLVSAGDTTCRFWDVLSSQKAKQIHSVSQHDLDYEVECLEVSLDGTLLATGGRDNKIVLSTININEDELDSFSSSQKTKARDPGFRKSTKASAKSSALLVDNAVQQNEFLENEKAKQIAKQTVKIKSSGTSDVLQSKLLELKSNKPASVEAKKIDDPSAAKEERPLGKPNAAPFAYPDKDYETASPQSEPIAGRFHPQSKVDASHVEVGQKHEEKGRESAVDHQERRQQHPTEAREQQSQENPEALYQNGLILNSIRNPQLSNSNHNRHDSQTTLDSNYDIDDVANELIRLSEEQQSFDARL